MSNLPATQQPNSLDISVLQNIQSYDEFLDFYISLDQNTTALSWFKADLLYDMYKKLGESSLEKFAQDTKQPRSTITNYVRTSRAFPPDKRDNGASFSLHFQASYADSFDRTTQDFVGEKRFKVLEEAVDKNMSTRKLAETLQKEKQDSVVLSPGLHEEAQKLIGDINSDLRFFHENVLSSPKAYEIIESLQSWLRKERKKFQNKL